MFISVSMHSNSFQETDMKLCRVIKDYPRQVVEELRVLEVPGAGSGGLYITYFNVIKTRATPSNSATVGYTYTIQQALYLRTTLMMTTAAMIKNKRQTGMVYASIGGMFPVRKNKSRYILTQFLSIHTVQRTPKGSE